MTFGEKLTEARKQAGLTQQQFAEKLSVSRSAVAKWESDRGMPDVDNLKTMSRLLSVSLDYLLEDDEMISFQSTKQPISLDDYVKEGSARSRQDAACLALHENAEAIYPLIRTRKLSLLESVTDFIVQPGIMQLTDYLNDNSACYLVEENGRQYLVSITADFAYTTELNHKVDPGRFVIGNHRYRKAAYRLK